MLTLASKVEVGDRKKAYPVLELVSKGCYHLADRLSFILLFALVRDYHLLFREIRDLSLFNLLLDFQYGLLKVLDSDARVSLCFLVIALL